MNRFDPDPVWVMTDDRSLGAERNGYGFDAGERGDGALDVKRAVGAIHAADGNFDRANTH